MRLLAWLAGTAMLLVLAAGGLLFLATDTEPLVKRSETISPVAIAQARWLLLTNDPRRLRAGDARRTPIPAALIDEGINYAASRFLKGRGRLLLAEKQAELRLSIRLPGLPVERHLNLIATLGETDGEPHLSSARIGKLPLPPALVEWGLDAGLRLAGHEREWLLARQAIRELRFEPDRRRIVVGYVWEPALLERARAMAVTPDDQARLRSAHEMLVDILRQAPAGKRIALTTLLAPLLDVSGSDQIENRRAAIFVLAAYLSERNLASVIPEAASWPAARPIWPTLLGRIDSAQHFVISAALAAWAGEPIADAIGLYKEMADARHGSGFSFADLAADRAGTTFGELLIRHPERIDQLLKKRFSDTDLVPDLGDLPEGLNERDFRRRFGAQGSPAYQALSREIDQRVAALPLYNGLPKP